MTTDITKQLDKISSTPPYRPRLRSFAPLAYWVTFVYALMNLLLGISLFFALDDARLSASLLIVNDITSYKFWGVVFMFLGVMKFYGLFGNHWNLTKRLMLLGVAVKVAWAIALIIRSLVSPGTILVSLLWLSLAAIQMITVIFFVPSFHPVEDEELRRRENGSK